LWEAWQLANQWGTRPSELYGITEALAAHNFDRAVMYFGSHVEAEMHEAAEKAKTNKAAKQKAQQVLNRWLAEEGDGIPRFRDPAAGR
jgi:hypothetical protein